MVWSLWFRLHVAGAMWNLQGELPVWEPSFPDHDCNEVPEYVEFRERLVADAATISPEQLLSFEIDKDKCPLGYLFMEIVHNKFDGLQFPKLSILLGTEWPFLSWLSTIMRVGNDAKPDRDVKSNCNWMKDPFDAVALRHDLWKNDWTNEKFLEKGYKFVYDLSYDWQRTFDECPLGSLAVTIMRMHICGHVRASCYDAHAKIFDVMMAKLGLDEIALASNWPIFPMLARIQISLRRHEYRFDFKFSEIVPQHMIGTPGLPEAKVSWHKPFSGSAREAAYNTVLWGNVHPYIHKGKLRHLVYITMVFGEYNQFLRKFILRAAALGIYYLLVYCFDEECLEICEEVNPERCIPGKKSMLNKFALPLILLNLGVDVFYLDFDTYLMKNPNPYLFERLRETDAELLVSASFADDCICSGIIFYMATEAVSKWLFLLLSWMYENTHSHDQQTFSAFLGKDMEGKTRPEITTKDENIRKYFIPLLPELRWVILDPVIQFPSARTLNTTGWMGNLDDMVVFHFLLGGSELNTNHGASSYLKRNFQANGTKGTLSDIFYGEPEEYYVKINNTLSESMANAVSRSRRYSRPPVVHCGPLGWTMDENKIDDGFH